MIKKFANFINESKEVMQVPKRPINAMERDTLKKFQELVILTYEYQPKDFHEFVKRAKPYLKYPFAKPLKNYISTVKDFEAEREQAANIDDIYEVHDDLYNKVLADFKGGNIDKSSVDKLKDLNGKIGKINLSVIDVARNEFRNPYKLSSARAFFGGRPSLVPSFDKEDLEDFKNMNLDGTLYTHLNFPSDKLVNFENMLYFLQSLSEDPKPIRLNKSKIKGFADFLNSEKVEYAEFIANIDSYLYNNNRKLIDKILSDIKKYPELVKANNKLKNKYKLLYRGVGYYESEAPDDLSKESVVETDKKQRYVATSPSEYVARSFAEMRGHLESIRRSNIGYLITYEVDADSVILDTSIFGSPYGEDEILIDATKARVKSVKDI